MITMKDSVWQTLQENIALKKEVARLKERLTPKKPMEMLRPHYKTLVCPRCQRGGLKTPFCRWCGQAIDWSDDK